MDSQRSQHRFTFNTFLALAGTYLGTLVILAYPLAFATFWVQVWQEHTNDISTALYAVSMVPVAVVVAKAFIVFITALLIVGSVPGAFGLTTLITLVAISDKSGREEESKKQLSDERSGHWLSQFLSNCFTRWLCSKSKWQVFYFFSFLTIPLEILLTAWIWVFLGIVSLNNVIDILFYVCALLVASGAAVIVSLVLSNPSQKTPSKRELYSTMLAMAGSAVVASLLLVPVLPTKLPVVQFSEGQVKEATLISHSEGYWYVVSDSGTSVMAIPDDAVGTATVSKAPRVTLDSRAQTNP